jgi:pyruvate/2-oxoglutarate dehydrogenase complex dihydrolipoamide dehydrogenase (E3) component
MGEAVTDSTERIETDICVIGTGSAGLSVAAGASQMGARTVLIEKGAMGGDCLNFGCVPSKALLAAAHAAHAKGGSAALGVADAAAQVDFAKVHEHVQGVIAAIAPMDSVQRFTGLGVDVYKGAARLTGKRTVAIEGGPTIKAKFIVIATGSRPSAPPVEGLDGVPYLTNETLFELTGRPAHLLIMGGGPIGIEMAQAHARLGCKVTVVEMASILGKDDPELVEVIRRRLLAEGVVLKEGAGVERVEKTGAGVRLHLDGGEALEGSHLLVAAGRKPNVEDLGLDAGGVAFDRRGVTVDKGLRSTTNKRVYAIGDVAGGPQFTHVAGYHAGVLIRRMLFKLFWTKADYSALPWVTYTDPELAHVGQTEAMAREHTQAKDLRILRWGFAENDRAQAERSLDGMIKVVVTKKGKILGASIAGAHAGDLIQPWILVIQNKLKIGKMASYIAPYPTLGEVSKRAAGSFFTPSLFSDRTRKIVRFLLRWS